MYTRTASPNQWAVKTRVFVVLFYLDSGQQARINGQLRQCLDALDNKAADRTASPNQWAVKTELRQGS